MSDERPTSEVKITGDGNVVGDGSSAQVVKAESGATTGNVTQIGKVVIQVVGRNVDEERVQRNRRAMLEKVRNFWVEGVLEQSLHGVAMIELGLAERADAVEHPWDMVLQTEREDRTLPPGTRVVDVFDGMGRNLLILGEPGSGKTTMLLELARDTIARAEKDPTQLIPVVLNLSSWTEKRQPIAEWLVEELNTKYDVPKKVARSWVENDDLLLLLDGLDEVRREYREDCVRAINDFRKEHLIPLAVCSRVVDYQALTTRLKLRGAVLLQPLTPQQIDGYLHGAGMALSAVRETLQRDPTLQELAETPLMLSVITLAYRGRSVEDLQTLETTVARRKHVFESYVQRMFERRGADQPYPQRQTIHWLVWLAQEMSEHEQSVFLIERLQPDWLPARAQRQRHIVAKLAFGLVYGLIVGLAVIELSSGLVGGLGLAAGLGAFAGLVCGLLGGQLSGLDLVEPVEALKWSWRKAKSGLLVGLGFAAGLGAFTWVVSELVIGLAGGWGAGLAFGWRVGLFSFVCGGMMAGVTYGLSGFGGAEIESKMVPNQGIRRSAKNALIGGMASGLGTGLGVGLVGGLAFGPLVGLATRLGLGLGGGLVGELAFGPLFGLASRLGLGLVGGLAFGLLLGLAFGPLAGWFAVLQFGGKAAILHFILRYFLWRGGYLPWSLVRFLDHAAERILLRKVGGGYIFIHRLLQDYFASLYQGQ
jgi:hypothetical protein